MALLRRPDSPYGCTPQGGAGHRPRICGTARGPGMETPPRMGPSGVCHAALAAEVIESTAPSETRVSPSGKAPASQAGIRGFESRHPLHRDHRGRGTDSPALPFAQTYPDIYAARAAPDIPRPGSTRMEHAGPDQTPAIIVDRMDGTRAAPAMAPPGSDVRPPATPSPSGLRSRTPPTRRRRSRW